MNTIILVCYGSVHENSVIQHALYIVDPLHDVPIKHPLNIAFQPEDKSFSNITADCFTHTHALSHLRSYPSHCHQVSIFVMMNTKSNLSYMVQIVSCICDPKI